MTQDPARSQWHRVWATREGCIGQPTATGHIIKKTSIFVALPSVKALRKWVRVIYPKNLKYCVCPVWDVGPWNVQDDYWTGDGIPKAVKGIREPGLGGKPKNPAGIDLSDACFYGLGLPDNAYVLWQFYSPAVPPLAYFGSLTEARYAELTGPDTKPDDKTIKA